MLRRVLLLALATGWARAQEIPKFALPRNPIALSRPTQAGVFLDVAGPRSAFFGYENGSLEGWLYPLKVFQDMELAFRLEGYPVDIQGKDIQRTLEVHPEYSVLTYAHSAFTVRQILVAPRSQRSLVSLLDIDSALPMTVTTTFRPRLRLMWPGAVSTPYVDWDAQAQLYRLSEESKQFRAVLGMPGARDLSSQPYQEEPKDSLLKLELALTLERQRQEFIPLVAAADEATYRATLSELPKLMKELEQHYAGSRSLAARVPEPWLQEAYDWSLVGMDKGMVQSPHFPGPGLVAGFRTSGESERPGFAWFFGRDAMWTAMATLAASDWTTTRQALDFLAAQQRADGKIPHEIAQSAGFVDWFQKYPYAWASSDATPLFVIVHGQLYAASGDKAYLERHWPALRKAWLWSAAGDTDGDGLMENTNFGHAWVEGGALYPPHQEIYLQGCFLEASRQIRDMARAMGDNQLAAEAERRIATVAAASEKTFWRDAEGFYAFGTARPRQAVAEPGPERARRQARLDELGKGGLVVENTVLPAVPLMWGWLDPQRAQKQLDQLASAQLSTDWGARILSNQSRLYDPLAYHYGSVWPLFTGWVSLAGYRHGRPHLGWQALVSNAALTRHDTLGYVTELLSGDYCSAFGRSSHHQIWSEAMVTLPLVRGLAGLEIDQAGTRVQFAPQPPAHWPELKLERVQTARGPVQLRYVRQDGRRIIRWQGPEGVRYRFTFSLSPETRVKERGQRLGDVQQVHFERTESQGELVLTCEEGCEAALPAEALSPGMRSRGLRILRCYDRPDGLYVLAEGLAGHSYRLHVRGRSPAAAQDGFVNLTVPGNSGQYRRLEQVFPY